MAETTFEIVERREDGEVWQATCPADPTIKPRRLKEKPAVQPEALLEPAPVEEEVTDETDDNFGDPEA